MALDTREKRASALACGLAFLVSYPVADATIGAGDRQQVAALYSGVLAVSAAPPVSEAQPQMPYGRLIEVAAPFGRLIE